MNKVRECFSDAERYDKRGRKHKGLMAVPVELERAKIYIDKAKTNLQFCEIYKEKRMDFKLPEEWFYTMYYSALAILAVFGVESRSQKCTALFLRYIKDKGLIDYDDEFIDRITVYNDKDIKSDVDEREECRYGPAVQSDKILKKYDGMMELCRRCLAQCETAVFSDKKYKIPEELL